LGYATKGVVFCGGSVFGGHGCFFRWVGFFMGMIFVVVVLMVFFFFIDVEGWLVMLGVML
jgi:hypothetical protein